MFYFNFETLKAHLENVDIGTKVARTNMQLFHPSIQNPSYHVSEKYFWGVRGFTDRPMFAIPPYTSMS